MGRLTSDQLDTVIPALQVDNRIGRSEHSRLESISASGARFLFAREYFGPDRLGPQLKKQFGGVYIANEKYNLAQANQVIQEGEADAVALGRLFVANPDLPARSASDALLNVPDPSTFFTPGPHGYTDYRALGA